MNFISLLSSETIKKLITFVQEICNKYDIDESHGIQHSFGTMHYASIITDYYIARKIILINGMDQVRASCLILITAFIHDMVDNKYIEQTNTIFEVNDKIVQMLNTLEYNFDMEEIHMITNIMINMSYTKRKKMKAEGSDIDIGKCQLALEIVRDADLLEGYNIDRCKQYSSNKLKYRCKELHMNVYELMSERVLAYKERDISTEVGKKIANILHDTLRIQLCLP